MEPLVILGLGVMAAVAQGMPARPLAGETGLDQLTWEAFMDAVDYAETGPMPDYGELLADYQGPLADYQGPLADYQGPLADYEGPLVDYEAPQYDYAQAVLDYLQALGDDYPSNSYSDVLDTEDPAVEDLESLVPEEEERPVVDDLESLVPEEEDRPVVEDLEGLAPEEATAAPAAATQSPTKMPDAKRGEREVLDERLAASATVKKMKKRSTSTSTHM